MDKLEFHEKKRGCRLFVFYVKRVVTPRPAENTNKTMKTTHSQPVDRFSPFFFLAPTALYIFPF